MATRMHCDTVSDTVLLRVQRVWGSSIKAVRKEGEGSLVQCRHLQTGGGVKDLEDVCKLVHFLLQQFALRSLSMGDA